MPVQPIHIKDKSQIFVGEFFVQNERATQWLVHLPVFCLLLLNLLAFFHRFVCLHCDFPSSADRECVCARSDTPKGEVGRVTEETPFVFGLWMSYYPFLLFTHGMASW